MGKPIECTTRQSNELSQGSDFKKRKSSENWLQIERQQNSN
jgi:hypothetical protein